MPVPHKDRIGGLTFLAFFLFPLYSLGFVVLGRVLPFLFPQVAPSSAKVKRISRDIKGKNVIVTGANSGVGSGITKELLRRGANVTMACRSATRAEKARSEFISELSAQGFASDDLEKRLTVAQLDTSSLASVREFGKAVVASGRKVDLLYLNAGIGGATPDGNVLTSDGQTNFLGHFLLVNLLEPILAEDARIVSTSSFGALLALSWKDFSTSSVVGKADPGFHFSESAVFSEATSRTMSGYSYSKAMQIIFTRALNDRALATGSQRKAFAFHPGLVSSNFFTLTRQLNKLDFVRLVGSLESVLGVTPEESAQTPVLFGLLTDEGLGPRSRWSKVYERGIAFTTPQEYLDPDRFWVRWSADAGIDADWAV
ncbi:hypothetical protein OC845_003630 [Tilletia horrida]|nr:hypothetical protein OC845_003630 [Tilletia horrida]